MVKLVYLILLSFAFFGLGNCTYYVWNGTVTNGYWNQGSSWLNGTVPGSGDCVFLPASANVIINTAVSIGNVSMNAATLYITNGGSLTVNNDINFAAAGASLLKIDNGASMTINGRFQLSTSSLTFQIFGTATANGLRISNAAQITQNGPSPVMITGTAQNIIDNSYLINQNIFYFATATQQFVYLLGGAVPTLTFGVSGGFNSAPVISTFVMVNSYQNPNPINLIFNGATFTTTTPITTSNTSAPAPFKPSVTFNAGLYTLPSGNVVIDGTPTFNAPSNNVNTIVINGGTLAFSINSDATFLGGNTLTIMGTGALSFTSNNAFGQQSAVFSGTVNINTPITFIQSSNPSGLGGIWNWNGGAATLNIYSAFTVQALIIISPSTTFFAPLQLGPAVSGNPVGIRGSPTLTNGLINNAGNQQLYNAVTLTCTQGSFTFSSSGSNNLQIQAGFTVKGCAVSAASGTNVAVVNPIIVNGNSSIDVNTVPLNTTANYPNYNFIGAGTPPANTLFSLTIINSPTFQINNTITATGVTVVFANTINSPAFPYGLTFAGSGQFEFPATVNVNDMWTVSATAGFPSGTVTINRQSGTQGIPTNWAGAIILRGTTFTGNAPIYYTSSNIFITNGISSITTPTFQLYSALNINYQSQSNPGFENPTLVFNSGQARVWFNALTVPTKASAIFDENLIFNTSVTFSTTAPNSTIVFRGGNTITSVGPQSSNFNFAGSGLIQFNQTTQPFRFTGPGTFNLNSGFVVQGSINTPFVNTDATVLVNSATAYVVGNSVFGPTVAIQTTGLTTDDGDQNATTALTTLTLQGFTGIPQVLSNIVFTLGTNITFTNSIVVTATTSFNGNTGAVTFQGSCITVQAPLTFTTRVIFPNNINFNTSTSQTGTRSVTFAPNTGGNNNGDGVWFQGNVNVQAFTQLLFQGSANLYYNVYFTTAATVGGNGVFNPNFGNLVALTGTVTLSPFTVCLQNALFSGPGSWSLAPTDNTLRVSGVENANTGVTYSGSNVLLLGNTNFTNNFVFTTTNTLNFTTNNNGYTLTFMGGATRTIATTYLFYNVSIVYFNTNILLTTAAPFLGVNNATTQIYFYFDVLTSGVTATIPQSLQFGISPTFSSATLGSLVLTGPNIQIFGNLNFQTGSTVTTSYSGLGIQTITGGPSSNAYAAIPGNWNFAQITCFKGFLNFTSPASFSIAHNMNGGTLSFTQGLTLNAPATFSNNANGGSTNNFFIQNYLTVTGNVALGAAQLTTPTNSPFSFNGTGSLTLLTSYTCNQNVYFSIPVTFTYIGNSFASTSVVFGQGCSWYPVGTINPINLYVKSFASGAPAGSVVYTPLSFNCFNSPVSVGGSNLYLFGNIMLNTTRNIDFAGTNFGPITVTSTTNSLATGINPYNAVTFSTNSPIPNAEPNISFSGVLTQPIVLTSPHVLLGVTMGGSSSITSTGNGRADFANSLTLTSTVYISQPYNFFVIQNTTTFTLSCTTGGGPGAVFTFAPVTYNPFGYGAPSFSFTTDRSSTIKFISNTTYSFNNVNIAGAGTVRFSGPSGTTATVNVIGTIVAGAGSTLWVDLVKLSAQNVTILPAVGLTPAANLKISFSSQPTSAYVTTQYATYGGAAVVYLSNYVPTSLTPVPFVSAGITSGQLLTPVGGSPGYTYSIFKSSTTCLSVNINPNAKPSPAPTPSNGPGPNPVSASTTLVISTFILLVSFILAIVAF